jgi:hypothetical protein
MKTGGGSWLFPVLSGMKKRPRPVILKPLGISTAASFMASSRSSCNRFGAMPSGRSSARSQPFGQSAGTSTVQTDVAPPRVTSLATAEAKAAPGSSLSDQIAVEQPCNVVQSVLSGAWAPLMGATANRGTTPRPRRRPSPPRPPSPSGLSRRGARNSRARTPSRACRSP